MEEQGHGAQEAVPAGPESLRCYVLRLPGSPVEAKDPAAVNDIGIEGIGRDIGVLVRAYADPVAEGDLPAVAAAGDADGAAFLLPAVNPVRGMVIRA